MIQKTMAELAQATDALPQPLRFMEVCGTHTMAAFRSGLSSLLPKNVQLLSGPGCPVCVTADSYIDQAVALALRPDVCVTTFGDMLRVPGSQFSLETARARGACVRVVYSPLDALQEARENPERQVVFLGVGFETTAPAVAATILAAAGEGMQNFSVLCAHKTMPNAMAALLQGGETRVDGFLCPGHVSVIIGARAYEFIPRDYGIPCVVAGFEPADMAEAIAMLVRQRLARSAAVEIQYHRAVGLDGNARALAVLQKVFEPCDVEWRGLGIIPGSGLAIRDKFSAFDAAKKLGLPPVSAVAKRTGCICGDVLRGVRTPLDCPLFRKTCSPGNPIGVCMVSSEGTCAAYFRYSL